VWGKQRSQPEPAAASEAAVLDALRKVQDPEIHKDLITLNMIKDLKVEGGTVRLTVELTTPACPLKEKIEGDVREALMAVPGVTQVELKLSSNVATSRATPERAPLPGVKHAVAIASGKGGVGKSTVSTNLAVALAEAGAQVGLLDGDIYGPSIPQMMGMRGEARSDGGKIIAFTGHMGVKVMSLGFFLPEGAPVVWRGPMVAGAIQQMLRDVDWGELDYLVVDLPPGTGDAQLTLSQTIPLTGAVIVMTPQDVAMNIAGKALAMFRQLKVPILGIIENMSGFVCPQCGHESEIFSRGGGRRAAERVGVAFLGEIPIDPEICRLSDSGQPLLVAAPESASAGIYRKVAGALAGRISVASLTESPTDNVVFIKGPAPGR